MRFIPSLLGLAAVVTLVLPPPGSLLNAQTVTLPGQSGSGGLQTERRPTTRDPRYQAPLIPEYMRRKLAPGADLLILGGGGEGVLESVLKDRLEKDAARERALARYESRRFSDDADSPADRRRFEAGVLRQFGVSLIPYAEPDEVYTESAGRRFEIVFGISMPITLGLTYGLASLARQSSGGSLRFNGTETGAMVGVGLGLAALIAWYDHSEWKAGVHDHLPGPSSLSPASEPGSKTDGSTSSDEKESQGGYLDPRAREQTPAQYALRRIMVRERTVSERDVQLLSFSISASF